MCEPVYNQYITEMEYLFFLAKGYLFVWFPECTGSYHNDKHLFLQVEDNGDTN